MMQHYCNIQSKILLLCQGGFVEKKCDEAKCDETECDKNVWLMLYRVIFSENHFWKSDWALEVPEVSINKFCLSKSQNLFTTHVAINVLVLAVRNLKTNNNKWYVYVAGNQAFPEIPRQLRKFDIFFLFI